VYERILVPTDGSTGTAHVAMQALDLAEQYGSTVYVLHVVDETASSLLEATGSESELEEQGERAVERIERMAQVHGVDTVTEIQTGDPASGIIDYAEEIDADLIVAGTHGRSGVQRRLIGSVAERLVRHAACPVMTVRLPESDETVTDEADARELAEEALAQSDRGDGEVTGVERQVSVWVVDIESDDGESLCAYIDPVTQRTSLVARH
jgi:nucleotide-binding universal stress UspA family protein